MSLKTFPRIIPLTKNNFPGTEIIKRKDQSFGKNAIPRAVWVRAVSNAVEGGSDKIIGNLNILVGGLLSEKFNTRGSFQTLYRRPGRQIQDKPIPGIDSIEITSKGEYQSLRKLTINWSCPNIEDLDILSPYWLSPGISVWVEWGWGKIGTSIITAPIENVKVLKSYYLDAEKIYNEIIKLSEGNQDAYLGVITNFTFNQNDDGSWTCTTELTSLGQTLISLDLNKDKIYKNFTTNQTENIKGFIKDKLSESKLSDLSIPEDVVDNKKEPISGKWLNHRDVLNLTKSKWLGIGSDDLIYVSWRFIEHQIINQSIAMRFEGGTAFKIDSSGVEISNDEFLFTTDAKIGLVVHREGEAPALKFDSSDSKSGYITNLYFETKFVKDTFENSETLEECLMKLLKGISGACGDIWNFKLQPNPMAEQTLQIVDLNYVSGNDLDTLKNDNILSLGGYSGKSILSNISFTSKLTDQIALKCFVSRNKSEKSENMIVNDDNDAGIQPMFGGLVDRVLKNLDPPKTPDEEDAKKEEIAKIEREKQEEKDRERFSLGLVKFKQAIKNNKIPSVAESGWPNNIIVLQSEGKELLVEYLNRDIEVGTSGTKEIKNRTRHSPIYPLEISVTIDGISGILPGHCFIVDNVPKIYNKDAGVFQVVEVSHNVSEEEWTTTLRCFFRYTAAKKYPIFWDWSASKEKEIQEQENQESQQEIQKQQLSLSPYSPTPVKFF